MALIEEWGRSGNWLFRWRSFLPIALLFGAVPVVLWAEINMPPSGSIWALFCLAVALSGQWVRALCVGFTPRGTSGRNTKEGQVAESLNSKGMYGHCRHPLYLGNLLMWLGIVFYMGSAWFAVVFLLIFWLYYERIMFVEEQFLRGKFGKAYLDWSDDVPAFLPKLTRWTSPGVPFSLRNVIKREYNGFVALFICFAWVDALHGFRAAGFEWASFSAMPFTHVIWPAMAAAALPLFLILRTIKKRTNWLDVKGREYV
jgi:protein-S-isoprenylcysteine O-methyltransferase Ste14